MDFYALARPCLMRMDPELAHRMTIQALKAGAGPRHHDSHPALETRVFGKTFPNPLGLAAGFDKDAEVLAPMLAMGFGFVEAGTVTPLPQSGNPRPRVFRDPDNKSILNRMGFPGGGLENFKNNVLRFRQNNRGVLGLNIGVNKDTPVPLEDYLTGLRALAPLADYIAINISSPNTPGLRDLQAKAALDKLLSGLGREKYGVPLLLKLSPDLTGEERQDIVALALKHGIDGLIVSNTTVSRPAALAAALQAEKGGLSGVLLREISTAAIRDFYRLSAGQLPIIGVGGIASAAEAYEKIRAGAALVQLYTGLIYQGPRLVVDILRGLPALLERDGFPTVAAAVGADMASGQAAQKTVNS